MKDQIGTCISSSSVPVTLYIWLKSEEETEGRCGSGDGERRKMTRGRKVTGRPYTVCLSLKEKRWNTHTDLPSVNRVCKGGREDRGVWAREGKAQRAAFVFSN